MTRSDNANAWRGLKGSRSLRASLTAEFPAGPPTVPAISRYSQLREMVRSRLWLQRILAGSGVHAPSSVRAQLSWRI